MAIADVVVLVVVEEGMMKGGGGMCDKLHDTSHKTKNKKMVVLKK